MVLDRKTHFFLGKRWFWTGKPGFVFGFFLRDAESGPDTVFTIQNEGR